MIDYDKLLPIQEWAESGGNPNAVSSKGAIGPMQTMRPTLAKPGYSVRPAENDSPEETRRVGQDYSRAMGKEYGEALPDMLAAYNWGPGNFNKWRDSGRDPAKMPKETKDYIAKISAKYYGEVGAPVVEAGAGRGAVNPPNAVRPVGEVAARWEQWQSEQYQAGFMKLEGSGKGLARLMEEGAAQRKLEKSFEPTGLEILGAAMAGTPTFAIARALMRPRFEAEPGFKPDMKLLPKDADDDLIESYANATSSGKAAEELRHWDEENIRLQTVANGGMGNGIMRSVGVEFIDPTNLIFPWMAARGLARAGMGAAVQFSKGRTAAGYASAVGESLISGTVVEAVKQSVEGNFSPADLGISLLADTLLGAGMGKLISRDVGHAFVDRAAAHTVAREADLATRAELKLGKLASVEEVRAEMEIIRKADANAVITDALADVPLSGRLITTDTSIDVTDPRIHMDSEGRTAGKIDTAYPTRDSLIERRQEFTPGALHEPAINQYTNGLVKTLAEFEALGPGFHVTGDIPYFMKPAVAAAEKLAKRMLGKDFTLTLGTGKIPMPNGQGTYANGAAVQVSENGAMIVINPDMSQGEMVRVAIHEVGHVIFDKHLHRATREQQQGIVNAFAAFLKKVEDGNASGSAARGDRYSLTNPALRPDKELTLPLRSGYELDFDEFSAEQFVKFIEGDISRANQFGLTAAVITMVKQAISKALEFLKLAKRDNLGVTDAYKEFFQSIANAPEVQSARATLSLPRRPQGPQLDEAIRQAVINNPDTSLRAAVDSAVASKWQSAHDIVRHYLDVPEHAEVANLVVTSAHLRNIPVVHVKAGDNLPALVASSFNNGAAAAAVVDSKGAKIYIRGDFPEGHQLDIPLHEVVHAVTMAAVERNPAIKEQLAAWAKQAVNHLDSIAFSGTRAKEDKAALDFFARVLRTAPADELLAYGTTSPTLRKVLSGMTEAGLTPKQDAIAGGISRVSPTEPARPHLQNVPELSLWDKFVDILRGVFGKPTKQGEVDKLAAKVEAVQAKYKQDLADYNSFKMLTPKLLQYLDRLVADSNLHGVQGGGPSSRYATNVIDDSDTVGPADVVNELMQDPDYVKYGLTGLPLDTPAKRKEAQAILALHKEAAVWEQKYPYDDAWKKRMKNLADNQVFNVASTGLKMLSSPSPVVRMVAHKLLEDASGVAGKRVSTAAIHKHTVERLMKKNVENDIQRAYEFWKKGKPGGHFDDMIGGKNWAAYNKELSAEIEARAKTGSAVSVDPSIKGAVDSIEAAYQRAANEMRRVNTLGSEGLPTTSFGYMPHRMSAKMFVTLPQAKRQVVHSALVDQFVSKGWDITFSDQLAAKYLDLARKRAAGDYGSAMGGAGSSDQIREALVGMGLPEDVVAKHMDTFSKGGAGFTKGRLELDLNKVYTVDGEDFKLLDIYETDQIELLRSQIGRASGEVALTKFGVRGKPGADIVFNALPFGEDGKRAGDSELQAFEQVMAEFFNEPYGKSGGKFLDRAMLANSLVAMGSSALNQASETINGIAHVGFLRAMASIPAIPRLRQELLALARGEKVDNPIIGSIEQAGGAEFGADGYKFVMPHDNPNNLYPAYGQDTPTLLDRLLRGGNHVQAILSGHRMIHAAQQRGMAEQIVHKMARYIRDGKDDIALDQFGIHSELRDKLRQDIGQWATFDGDRLVRFEVDKITDPEVREAVIQSVWRGTQQIIQGTFIGERGKWAHDGMLRMMTQFRSFSITSMEKQWGRQRNSHGVFGATGIILGAMSLAWPIYAARTYAASIGRPDQEAWLEERLSPQHVARATMNYVAGLGMVPDLLDMGTTLLPDDWGVKTTGGRSGVETDFVGNYIAPASSLVDNIWKYAQSPLEVEDAMRIAPFSRLPFVIPMLNTARD